MKKINFISTIICFSLFFTVFEKTFSQNHAFDSLANEINRLSMYKKTKSLELLDTLYKMAYNSPDSSLLIAHCLYEESIVNKRQGIIDTLLSNNIKERLARKDLSLQERAILFFGLGSCFELEGKYANAFEHCFQALELFKQLENNRFIAKSLNTLGVLCIIIKLYNLADYYHSEALLYVSPDSHDFYFIKNQYYRITVKKQ